MAHPRPTSHLTFREMTPDDIEAVAALLGDPDVMAYYPRPKTRAEALAWIAWNGRLYRWSCPGFVDGRFQAAVVPERYLLSNSSGDR